jgi:hypothetical protein
MRLSRVLGAVGLGVASMAVPAADARACGGCFHGPTQNGDVITDHRMIFSVSPAQTTLYDEIEYQGEPQGFAWVLPIHGEVQVGLSSDIVFAALDAATQTTIVSPPPPLCPSCSSCEDFGAGASIDAGTAAPGVTGGVNVIAQSVVGPYDTVQLQSTDPTALSDWLTANGFAIPADIEPVIAAYVQEGFDFLALKLQPGQGVQAMRPVSVTSAGAGLSLPLRMVAAGTGATVGVTLWVLAGGRYEAANFPNFTIDPASLVWDWSTDTSNYTTVQQQQESAAGFATWQTESSLLISPFQIENTVLYGDAAADYEAIPADDGGDGGSGETADEVRQQDLATLFPDADLSTVTVTRLRADLAHAALANDLVLQASADQSPLSNTYRVNQSVNAPACAPVPNPCPPCSSSGSGGPQVDGGVMGSLGVGVIHKGAAPGEGSSGCSAVPSQGSNGGFELALAGLIGVSFVRHRVRRKR